MDLANLPDFGNGMMGIRIQGLIFFTSFFAQVTMKPENIVLHVFINLFLPAVYLLQVFKHTFVSVCVFVSMTMFVCKAQALENDLMFSYQGK